MQLVTVHLPAEFIEGLDYLVRVERYPNRSEAIRNAVRDLLKEELWSQQRVIKEKERTRPQIPLIEEEKI
ncbi:MAG: ribbon-helix-helix domain-containing protein [Candidatus Wukongarchaeota archaeon]|nr:ribbon-helix-helix domain-containing protein [Candidatus Wukongarchaeota archaeon]